jgi:hypothetical protein
LMSESAFPSIESMAGANTETVKSVSFQIELHFYHLTLTG